MAILLAQYDEVNKLRLFQEESEAHPMHPVRLYPLACYADERMPVEKPAASVRTAEKRGKLNCVCRA